MRKNKLFKITIVLLIMLLLFYCIIPKKVYANDEELTSGFDNVYTGMMLEPLMEFFTFFVEFSIIYIHSK